MKSPMNVPEGSLRRLTGVSDLLRNAHSRHFTEAELESLIKRVPTATGRIMAAKEVAAAEASVVNQTVNDILSLYPFEESFGYGRDKCARDITFVSVYATNSMLINDLRWLDEQFLFWMKTMVRSFGFPTQLDWSTGVAPGATANPFPDITTAAAKLPADAQAIFDTYSRLGRYYQTAVSASAWELLEPVLGRVVAVLAGNENFELKGAAA